MKKNLTIILIIILNSCNPRVFNLLEDDINKMVSVYYKGKLYNLAKLNNNSLSFKDSLVASLKFFGVTNHIIEFNTRNIKEQNFSINLRNIFDKYESKNGISINIENNTYKIYKRGELFQSGILASENIYFYLENDGRYLKIKINCDDIYVEDINISASEYMIIENTVGSIFELSGLKWENLQLSKKNK